MLFRSDPRVSLGQTGRDRRVYRILQNHRRKPTVCAGEWPGGVRFAGVELSVSQRQRRTMTNALTSLDLGTSAAGRWHRGAGESTTTFSELRTRRRNSALQHVAVFFRSCRVGPAR